MATKDKVRVALIGAGGMANTMHYPSLSEMPDVEMAGICDFFEDKARTTAEKFGIPEVYTDYRKMLDEVAPDAVYCLMPPHHLFDLTVDVMKRGHAVFIEKPPGLTTAQTWHMARHAEESGVATMTGFQRRFSPVILEARRQVEERGDIIQCLARFVKSGGNNAYYNGAIDILTCDIIHAVDILRWMGGEVKKVASTVNAFHSKFENAFNALVEFENGGVGNLLSNFMVGRRIYSVEMHAQNISAYAEPDKDVVIYKDGAEEGETTTTIEAANNDKPHHYVGFFGENRHFIDCVKNGEQPQTNFADGVKTMELVDKIYRNQLQ